MINATNFLPCADIQTRQPLWVAVRNGEQLGVYNSVTIAAAFRESYADDFKPVTFCD